MQIPYGGCHGIAAVIDNEWEKINGTEMQKIKIIMNRKKYNDTEMQKIKMIIVL